MTRKLLPYEYQLIEALGISKEEYLDFVAKQHIHEDIKDGTVLDIRNEPVSIILAVVGIIFQVVSAFLLPKPETPQFEGTEQTRDQRLSPRLGFNSSQELAVYGDTVPLVYTNTTQNSNGGVRLSTLLLWSAILSFGNSQFMQLMTTLGAAEIGSIDFDRTALGQFAARDLIRSNVWQYYNPNGPTLYGNEWLKRDDDPIYSTSTQATAKLSGLSGNRQGFSQAYSPTTSNTAGVTGFIPINYDVVTLDQDGNRVFRTVDTSFLPASGTYWGNTDSRPTVPVGLRWTLIIPNVSENLLSSDTSGIARQDALRASASLIDNGSIFKAGTALFRVVSATYSSGSDGLENSNLTAVLECIRAGKMPRLRYDVTSAFSEGTVKSLQAQIDKNTGSVYGSRPGLPTETKSIAAYEARIATLQRELQLLYSGPLGSRNRTFIGVSVATLRRQGIDEEQASKAVLIEREIIFLENEVGNLKAENERLRAQIDQIRQTDTTNMAPFHTKGLARIDQAAYASVTKCNVLDLALRTQVYRRINGRANVYGSSQINYEHGASDNGIKPRTAMFTIWYRLDQQGEFIRLPFIFCARGMTEQNVFTYLKLVDFDTPRFWEVRLEPVTDTYQEIRTFHTRGYCYLNYNARTVRLDPSRTENPNVNVYYNGSLYIDSRRGDYPPLNKSPKDSSEFDLFTYDAYTQSSFSFDSGPEINITAVNEQLITPWSAYGPAVYRNLSNFALHVVSGAGTQDLRNISVWVNQGKLLRPISTALNTYGNEAFSEPNDAAITALANSNPSVSSSYAPDIFLDTILDADNGIGRYAKLHSVDVLQLAKTKRFCERNRLFMDGVIATARPWREFWAATAPFSLLELGKIGGKDTLVPALPYDANGNITRAISVSALFNTGNILEDSYKEEFIDYGANVQDVIITLVYRDVERNGIFPRNNSVEVQRTDTLDKNAIRETLDVSQFVTTRSQAIMIGKYLCSVRRYNRRAIEFRTFPTESFVMPGSYIYVETSNNQWEGIYTGRLESGGSLNVPVAAVVPNGTYSVLVYGSTNGVRTFNNVSIINNTAASLSRHVGELFVLGQAVRSKRVFRVTEVSMDEEGETTIRAVEHPCDTNGNSFIAEGISTYVSGIFTIDGTAE
jgi:hypothetical protein